MSKARREVLDYCADLLTEDSNRPFLRELFARPKSGWSDVHSLCEWVGVPVPPPRGPGTDLYVAWLDDPTQMEGYCIIAFFSPSEIWSNMAIYNRDLFFEYETSH